MKISGTLYITFLSALSLIACTSKPNTKVEFINTALDSLKTAEKISLSDLVNNFKSLDGRTIQTEGIVFFEFENVAIFLNKGYDKNCFWLDLNRNLSINDSLLQKVSGQRFVIKGTIDISSKGHLGAYLATIRDVYYLKSK